MDTKIISDKVAQELRECRNSDEVESFFRSMGIKRDEYAKRSLYLKAAMGETSFYYTGGAVDMEPEELYLDDEVIFLNGKWRELLSK